MNNKSPGNWLVIGCGSIGERHIRNIQSIQKVEVIACDRDRGRRQYIQDTYGISVYHDYKEALLNKIEAAIICTPSNAHISPALASIRQGCHVLIEKPLSHNLKGVDDLIMEAKQRDLVLMIGFNFFFHPSFRLIKKIIDQNSIGKLITVRVHAGSYFLYRTPFHHWIDYHQDYAAQRNGGGVILDSATHHIEYLISLLGEVKEVFCYAGKIGKLELQAEDTAEILLKFLNGTTASLHVNFVQQPYQVKNEIIGQEGTILWNVNNNTVRLFSAEDNKWKEFPIRNNFDHNETYIDEIKHFLKCIIGKEDPPVDGVKGKRILEIALAARKSSRTGRVVSC